MENDYLKGELLPSLKAIEEAEQRGEHAFTCPICGGKAKWYCAVDPSDNLCSYCRSCGFAFDISIAK